MSRRFIRLVAVLALLVPASITTVAVVAPTAFAATGQICTQYGSTTQGNYIIMNNRWGTTATQCINVTTNGFQIVQQDGTGNLGGAPTAYPAIYAGCHYSNCSPNTNMPALISSITSANSSVTTTYPSSGTYDAAYDIWINDTTNVTGVQKTEIMIWLNHTGSIQPVGSNTGTTFSAAGKSWNVWSGNNGSNNVVSYVANPAGVTSVSFDVMAFVKDAMTRGSGFGTNSWYLTSIQMGFEPWVGGVGLSVNSFSATVNTGNPPPPTATPVRTNAPTATPVRTNAPTATPVRTNAPTATPVRTTAPTGTAGSGTASCAATLAIASSWATGFTANVTVKAGSSAIKTWKVTWTWPGNQAITNSWSATVTSSGTAVTASNLSYNGALAAAASTSFGFQASFSGTNTAPTLTCSAT
jgi:Glycosyl hydrolase family 12/Cellulose binding domain